MNIRFYIYPLSSRSAGWVIAMLAGVSTSAGGVQAAEQSAVVPGYVAPVTQTPVAAYADDTRGVYVPSHEQLRSKTGFELATWNATSDDSGTSTANGRGQRSEQTLNRLANGFDDTNSELERIGSEPGMLEQRGSRSASGSFNNVQVAQNYQSYGSRTGGRAQPGMDEYPSLATGGQARAPQSMAQQPMDIAPAAAASGLAKPQGDGGVELAVGSQGDGGPLDLQHSIVKLKEERVSVRRALQRMLDQVGGNGWSVVWDLDEVNAGLPDMEISIYAEEPFVKVLNALLARLQTRSGQPLRVIKYDKTQRLVITDRTGDDARSASIGAGQGSNGSDVAVTESVLKESKVSLHYDEVPLVDALENIVNQAGKGQWRLRMYAGTDQVLKPAHVEEPFSVAVERILKVFNLRYEVFPGGKLIVVTGGDRFGFRGVE